MKTKIATGVLSALLVAGPIHAEQRDGAPDGSFGRYATKENIGRAIGTAAGALIGSQFADGSTKVLTAAIGGVAGFLLGGHVGRELSKEDQAGLTGATQEALDTGRDQEWSNPDTGVAARVAVRDEIYPGSDLVGRVTEVPALELINGYYVTQANTNVRGGPGTEYTILHRIAEGERLPVIGQVIGSDWYMVAERGSGSGFIYAPLLSPAVTQPYTLNAIRDARTIDQPIRSYAVEKQSCRAIDQEIRLPDGNTRTHSFRACQQQDGSWAEV